MDDKTLATVEEIQRARDKYDAGSDNTIEIDEECAASHTDDGVWIAAWVWLAKPVKKEKSEPKEEIHLQIPDGLFGPPATNDEKSVLLAAIQREFSR